MEQRCCSHPSSFLSSNTSVVPHRDAHDSRHIAAGISRMPEEGVLGSRGGGSLPGNMWMGSATDQSSGRGATWLPHQQVFVTSRPLGSAKLRAEKPQWGSRGSAGLGGHIRPSCLLAVSWKMLTFWANLNWRGGYLKPGRGQTVVHINFNMIPTSTQMILLFWRTESGDLTDENE